MKTKSQPPLIRTDDHGHVTNFAEIARFGYVNDPSYRKTDAISDLLHESYVARLERQVATQIIEKATRPLFDTPAPVIRVIDTPAPSAPARQLTVVSPSDNHEPDLYMTDAMAAHVVGRMLVLGVVVAALGVGLYAHITDHGVTAATSCVLAAGGAWYLVWKGGTL